MIVGRRRVDREPDVLRGVAACWHLHRALELELVRRELAAASGGERRPLHLERAIAEHARIARGYLGAVGFERESLWRARSAPA